MFEFDEQFIEAIIKGVYDGKITEYDLPEDLYFKIAEYLKTALYEGFGFNISTAEGTALDLLTELRDNVYMFSGAKTYSQIKEMTELLTKDDQVTSWQEFKEGATEIFQTYNQDWLKAEYDTAISQGQNAVKWDDIEQNKEVLPYLRYNGTEDANECDICEPLNGLVAPVDDPVWDAIMPSNHFNCRCTVDQLDETGESELTPDDDKSKLYEEVTGRMDDVFKMNPGKDGVIFNEDHPYFEVAKGDKDFAKENFGLDIPEKDDE